MPKLRRTLLWPVAAKVVCSNLLLRIFFTPSLFVWQSNAVGFAIYIFKFMNNII